jgi:hypothetical protein
LRYFNEKTKKTCGRCDVCQRQAVVPYDSIEEKLRTVMGEEELPVKEVLSRCDEFDESQVLDAIRFLVDNGVLQVEDDGMVKRNDNKKSRR